jgi:hypothetical protein
MLAWLTPRIGYVCHGPNGDGSSLASALKTSLTTMNYSDFSNIVILSLIVARTSRPSGKRDALRHQAQQAARLHLVSAGAGFRRNTLAAFKCDVIIGYPQGSDVVQTTNPYYRTTYTLVFKPGRRLDDIPWLIRGSRRPKLSCRTPLLLGAKQHRGRADIRTAPAFHLAVTD